MDSLINGMNKCISHTSLFHLWKHTLPWVNKAIEKLIQAKNTVYVKLQCSKSPRLKFEKSYVRTDILQKQMRQAYWAYIWKPLLIFSHPVGLYNAKMTVPPDKKRF